ncbi:MAG: hypothetical protein AAGI24_04245 [Pseudomonadota bacterium]
MKNKLSDLNDHLFTQLERLNEEGLKGEKLEEEIERGKAIAGISRGIIDNAKLVLDAEKMKREGPGGAALPAMLSGDSPKALGQDGAGKDG